MAFNREMHNSGCPCKGCEDRDPGCHDKCERFQQWREKRNEIAEARRKYMESFNTMSDASKKYLAKRQKHRRGTKGYDTFINRD